MTPKGRRYLVTFAGILLLIASCLLFPRVLGFVELAARELRYLWWLILLLLLGIWLAFAKGSKK
jgi:hypothetical protein